VITLLMSSPPEKKPLLVPRVWPSIMMPPLVPKLSVGTLMVWEPADVVAPVIDWEA